MITLVASTVTLLVKQEKRNRYIKLNSDSTTVTRVGKTPSSVEMANMGFGFTAYDDIVVYLRAGDEIHGVSSGTPNISIAEVSPETVKNAIIIT
ncbi:MAG: hypothetical protein OIN86_13610 [Candidatus Methanoperedens sp.]|nr:hypothetical protein [Candidatus Methanoperedens sp.]CAG0950653.1 hypothetical protein METP1_00179 [Methanosarcinales archaeon]